MAGGQSIVVGQGSLSPSRGGRGQAFDSSAGSVGKTLTVAIVGAAIALSQGAATPNSAGVVPLSGMSASAVQGGIGSAQGQAISTGSSMEALVGTTTPTISPSPSAGLSALLSAGFAVVQDNAVAAHLSGSELAMLPGDVTPGIGVSGSIVGSGIGSLGGTRSVPLFGAFGSLSIGTVRPEQDAIETRIDSASGQQSPEISAAIAGEATNFLQGTLAATGDAFSSISGVEFAGATGTMSVSVDSLSSGLELLADRGPIGAPGQASLSGVGASSEAGRVFLNGDRDYPLVGSQILVSDGLAFASSLAFPPGVSAAVEQAEIGPRDKTLAAEVTAQPSIVADLSTAINLTGFVQAVTTVRANMATGAALRAALVASTSITALIEGSVAYTADSRGRLGDSNERVDVQPEIVRKDSQRIGGATQRVKSQRFGKSRL